MDELLFYFYVHQLRWISRITLIILLELFKLFTSYFLRILESEPGQDPLCEAIDPLTMIDVIQIPIPAEISTNTSPAKSDVEQSNIVSSTASGTRENYNFIRLHELCFKNDFKKLPGGVF